MDQTFLSYDDFFKNCTPQTKCSVCVSNKVRPFMYVGAKYYWTCNVCKARILSCQHWLSEEDEFKYYQTHQNISSDPAYQRFAARLALPILEKLVPYSRGLDFGCGPDSALSAILRQRGHDMTLYDPFFFPANKSLNKTYDFIVCSEAAEHFYHPAKEFRKFNHLLIDNGWLGLMTNFQTENARFKNWHYRRDPTHVVFYRKETFEVIGKQFKWTAYFPSPNVVLFQKTRETFKDYFSLNNFCRLYDRLK